MGLRREYELAVRDGLRSGPSEPPEALTADDLRAIPDCVRRYLHFAGAVDRPKITNFRLRFFGHLRNGPDAPWMRVHIDQQSLVEPCARLFLIKASMFGVPVLALHRYVGPSAIFRVKILGLFTIVDAHGPKLDQSETVTLLNDMCLLAPATLVSSRVAWSDVGDLQARATFSNAGHTVSALLTFDDSGALLDFMSTDRYRTVDGKSYALVPWSTPVHKWADFDGRRLPIKAEARWIEPQGELCYARFEVTEAAYNVEGADTFAASRPDAEQAPPPDSAPEGVDSAGRH